MLETGRGKRQKSYIFCLLWFIITFSSSAAFARGGWLELQSSSPSCSPQVGSQWQVCPDWLQLRTLPMCLGNLLHSILQETADKISIQRCRGGSGLLKQQANLCHLQYGWAGTLLEPAWYNSLETLASASFPAWNRPQGEVKNSVPVLPCCSQEYFLQKWQAAGGELPCSGIVKQL